MAPLTFQPLYMTRVWGGRSLESVYGRQLPDDQPYGESWEVVDRPGEQSVVVGGPHAGKSLHELWANHREDVFGPGLSGDRFPLLIKILDAQDDLSIQVHPPAELAPSLGGEPKTEMWFIADAKPDAKLYVGFKEGVTRDEFAGALADGTVADKVHAISPKAGESIFIPSGRLHAIGAGLVIYEIQQNSDTTYRVFDWNRVGLDGKPRDLHIDESMQSIDFNDFEPGMDEPQGTTIAQCDYFRVDKIPLARGADLANPRDDRFSLVTVVEGSLADENGGSHAPGSFLLLPAGAVPLMATADSVVLQTTIP